MFSRFRAPLTLGLLSLALLAAVSRPDVIDTDNWKVGLLLLGLAALVHEVRSSPAELGPPLDRWLGWTLVLFPCYVALQLVPVPLFLLQVLSPARAAIAAPLAKWAPVQYVPLSIHPAATGEHLFRIVAYTLVFLLVRKISLNWWRKPWLPALPIIAVAGLEGALGIVQYFSDPGHATAQGTYLNRNQYAALLELGLPLTGMCAWSLLGRDREEGSPRVGHALSAGLLLLVAGLTLAGIIYSLSRMAFALALGAAALLGLLGLSAILPGRRKWVAVVGIALLFLASGFILSPERLVERFAGLPEEMKDEARFVWYAETLHLFADYPVLGCGLGSYDSAYPKYQTTALDPTIGQQGYHQIFAHNDYLQLLAELGSLGFIFPALLVFLILTKAVRAARSGIDRDDRLRGIACTAAITVLLLHSLVEFNVYLPANALILAWICGMVAGLPSPSGWIEPRRGILRPAWFNHFAVGLAVLLVVSASIWFVPDGQLRKRPSIERFLCRSGLCNTEASIEPSPEASRPGREAFQEALFRDAAAPGRWCDLGGAFLKSGDQDQAAYCYERALDLGRNVPAVLLNVAAASVRMGDNRKALGYTAQVLRETNLYDEAVFDFYTQSGMPLDQILIYGLPQIRSARGYMRHLLAAGTVAPIAQAWEWIASRSWADDRLAVEYVNFLVDHHQFDRAVHDWASYVGARAHDYPKSNGLFNADFEYEPTGSIFDWSFGSGKDVEAIRDSAKAHSGAWSLRLQFNGEKNLNYENVSQLVYVTPGAYRFQAYIQTQDVTTDHGVGFRITDGAGSYPLNVSTEHFLATTHGWKETSVNFTVPPQVKLLRVAVNREPSLKFDNKIAGTVWIDSLKLLKVK